MGRQGFNKQREKSSYEFWWKSIMHFVVLSEWIHSLFSGVMLNAQMLFLFFFYFGKCFNTLHRVSFGYYPQSLASYCCHNLNNDCFFSSYFSPLQETVLFLHSEPTDFVLNECFSDKYVTRHSFLDVAVFNTRTPTETPIKKILLSKISCRKSYFRPC